MSQKGFASDGRIGADSARDSGKMGKAKGFRKHGETNREPSKGGTIPE
jgi:hypothetical protein